MGKLEKKLILTANLSALTEAERIEKVKEMATAHQNNPALVPGLTPTPSSVLTQVGALEGLHVQRKNLVEQMKGITEQIHKADTTISNILVDQWASLAQQAPGMTTEKAKLLGYGIKGHDSGHASTSVATGKSLVSRPDISKIDVNIHLQHTLHIINNITGKVKLPAGMLRIDVYGLTGEVGLALTDLSQLVAKGGGYLGQATRGKFVNTFAANAGKAEYYVAVYIDKKTKKPVAQSPVVSALIN